MSLSNLKVLILGIDGFLGQHMYKACQHNQIKVIGTSRKSEHKASLYNNFYRRGSIIYNVLFDSSDCFEQIKSIVNNKNISLIINCICIKDNSNQEYLLYKLNVELPKFLDRIGIYIISFSTDCVVEQNTSSSYINSKKELESLNLINTLLIRTTFWGYDFINNRGLVNKLIDESNTTIIGYSNYLFSGVYIRILCNIILQLMKNNRLGIISIFSNKSISKLRLLILINNQFNLNKEIQSKKIDKNIDHSIKSDVVINTNYYEQVLLFYQDFKKYYSPPISQCRQCHSNEIKEVFDFRLMPLAGNFMKKEEIPNEKKYPMSLSFCKNCVTLQISEVFDQKLFFTDYRYSSSTNTTLADHFLNYAKTLKNHFPNHKSLLEIGCNDGIFLTPLSQIGFKVLGIDPANNIVKKGIKIGHNIINDFFNTKTANSIINKYGKFDIITANNVLAHIEDIYNVFNSIKKLLAPRGFIVLEVQYLKCLVEKLQYDFICHEHIFYYSVTAIYNIFSSRSLKITHIEENNIHGGSIRVYATHKSNKYIPIQHDNNVDLYLKSETVNKLSTLYGIQGFFNKVAQHRKNTLLFLNQLRKKNATIACYGASGRSVTYVNYCGIGNNYVQYFIDDSPERNRRYMPGTHTPIITLQDMISKRKRPDYIIITAWTFKDKIIKKLDWYTKLGGQIIIPFPIIYVT